MGWRQRRPRKHLGKFRFLIMNDTADDMEEKEPRSSRPFLAMIKDAEKAFSTYQSKCDNIDKLYGSLDKLADISGDREFQIFWANMEVLKPTIYSRAPVPVVTPRHTDGGQLPRKASELLERVLNYDVEADDLHDTLLQVRDDLTVNGRGVPWVLDTGECIHVDRCDFVHEPARKWREVGWVARRAYLTRDAMTARFPQADIRSAKFEHWKGKDEGNGDDYQSTNKKAQVWEIWSKADGVIWVTEGVDKTLDEKPPLFDVKGFFPCPKPAYATTERRTLKPVPDFVYYRDQVDEINELTARISSLSESLRLKGFYGSGVSEVGEAIEAAMKATDNKAILMPVSNLAALGSGSLKDSIVWLPVKEVAEVITALVALRRQLIEDVYEITGLSDIMRGSSEAQETATAQNLKAQYGSIRVRERQAEMVRVARDILRMKAEIYAESVPASELATMAQMEIPDDATVQMQQMQAQQQAEQAAAQGQEAPPPPDMSKIVTLEQIDQLLKDDRIRGFVLDVESDSTIAPNEEAEKASRIEFITAMGGFIQQAGAMVAQQPQTAPFAAELMKFTAGAFRAGRELGGAIDDFSEQVKGMAAQGQNQPDPAAEAAQADMQMKQQQMQADMQAKQADMQMKAQQAQADMQTKQVEAQMKGEQAQADLQAKQIDAQMRSEQMQIELQIKTQEHEMNMQKVGVEIEKIQAEIARINAQANAPRPSA